MFKRPTISCYGTTNNREWYAAAPVLCCRRFDGFYNKPDEPWFTGPTMFPIKLLGFWTLQASLPTSAPRTDKEIANIQDSYPGLS